MRGLAVRIEPLLSSLEQPADFVAPSGMPCSTGVVEEDDANLVLKVEDLSVALPDGTVLVKGLRLRLSAGQRLLVRGPNGCGKSSLVRVLAGIWGAAAGSVIHMPEELMVLPQRPYLVARGTLKQQLLYPAVPSARDVRSQSLWSLPDESLLQALEWAGLAHFAPTASYLHQPGLADSLSGGEQQRLGAARLLLRKPTLALLDEPTSACEPNFERALFGYCATQSLTLVTIAHRPELATFHTHELLLDGHGSFTLTELEACSSSTVIVGSSSGEDLGTI